MVSDSNPIGFVDLKTVSISEKKKKHETTTTKKKETQQKKTPGFTEYRGWDQFKIYCAPSQQYFEILKSHLLECFTSFRKLILQSGGVACL